MENETVQAPKKLLSPETSERICSSKWSFCPWKMFQKIKHQPIIKRHLQIVFIPNAGKYRPKKLRIWTLFMQCLWCKEKRKQTSCKCSLCPKEFKFKFHLKKHMNRLASQAAKFCSSCHLSFKELTILNLRKLPVLFLTVVLMNNLYVLFLVYLLLLLIIKLRQ